VDRNVLGAVWWNGTGDNAHADAYTWADTGAESYAVTVAFTDATTEPESFTHALQETSEWTMQKELRFWSGFSARIAGRAFIWKRRISRWPRITNEESGHAIPRLLARGNVESNSS
jgi:hypothetical protein